MSPPGSGCGHVARVAASDGLALATATVAVRAGRNGCVSVSVASVRVAESVSVSVADGTREGRGCVGRRLRVASPTRVTSRVPGAVSSSGATTLQAAKKAVALQPGTKAVAVLSVAQGRRASRQTPY